MKFSGMNGIKSIAQYRIATLKEWPLKLRCMNRNPAMHAIIDVEINKLLTNGHIEPSKSPFCAPITLT